MILSAPPDTLALRVPRRFRMQAPDQPRQGKVAISVTQEEQTDRREKEGWHGHFEVHTRSIAVFMPDTRLARYLHTTRS